MLQAAAEHLGMKSSLVPKIATGFCGGVSRTKGMCGAVSGGVMALGMIFGRMNADTAAARAYGNVQTFLGAFRGQHGSLNCFELTGCDFNFEVGRERFRNGGIKNRCRNYTGYAARTAVGIIEEETAGPGTAALERVREKIDSVDSEIIGLLSQRGKLVSEAGRLKKSETDVRAADRVEKVIENVRQKAADAGLDPVIAEKTYRTIIDCFINKETEEFRERKAEGFSAGAADAGDGFRGGKRQGGDS